MQMEFHRGRLLDHVHLVVTDLAISLRFYREILEALGRSAPREGQDFFWADELFVSQGGSRHSRIHLAFQANDEAAVGRFYEAGLRAGGRDNGAPGPRPYHPGYYAAYLLDPDGNNVEAVFHGPTTRSTESVVISPVDQTR